jgi:hypothetical protein
MGFAASSHAASLARPPTGSMLAPAGLATLTPAMIVGVGLWGALARRRRANQAGASQD